MGEVESGWILKNYTKRDDRFEGEMLTSSSFIKRKTVNSLGIYFIVTGGRALLYATKYGRRGFYFMN